MLFMFRVCHAFLSVHSSLVVTCWERDGLLALMYVMLSCVIVTFQCPVLGQVSCLIVSIPEVFLLTYFEVIGVIVSIPEVFLLTYFEVIGVTINDIFDRIFGGSSSDQHDCGIDSSDLHFVSIYIYNFINMCVSHDPSKFTLF